MFPVGKASGGEFFGSVEVGKRLRADLRMTSRDRKIFGQHETKGGKVENCRLCVEVEFFMAMWYNDFGIRLQDTIGSFAAVITLYRDFGAAINKGG